jgi:hypothetical protein
MEAATFPTAPSAEGVRHAHNQRPKRKRRTHLRSANNQPKPKRMRLVEPIETLSVEVLISVFEWLPWSDLLQVGRVCRDWRAVTSGRQASSSSPPPPLRPLIAFCYGLYPTFAML